MSTLTKEYLSDSIFLSLELTAGKAKKATEDIISVIKKAIFDKKLVYIPNHMKIGSSIKGERPGRNPKTGKDALVTRRHSIRATRGTFKGMGNKLTKSGFVNSLVDIGYALSDATILVETFYGFVGEVKHSDTRIEIRGLGVFRSVYCKKSIRRNPSTGESVNSKAHYKPVFKCSDSLRKAMDKEYL